MSDVWRKHLLQQDKVTAREDIGIRELGVDFAAAKRVLDLGTGYGDYLVWMASKHPDCEYVGVDNDEEAISAAIAERQRPGISFLIGDIESENTQLAEGQFDIAIARLVVQHLKAPVSFARNAFNHLRSGGQLVVIEAYEPFKRLQPDLPQFRVIFRDLRQRQKRARSGSLLEFQEILRQERFQIDAERVFVGYMGIHFSEEDFLEMCRLNLIVVRDYLDGQGDFDRAFAELEGWSTAPNRFASIGTYVLIATKERR